VRGLASGVIRVYQRWVSPILPKACRFEPTCSEYTRQAIVRYGVARGAFLGFGWLRSGSITSSRTQ